MVPSLLQQCITQGDSAIPPSTGGSLTRTRSVLCLVLGQLHPAWCWAKCSRRGAGPSVPCVVLGQVSPAWYWAKCPVRGAVPNVLRVVLGQVSPPLCWAKCHLRGAANTVGSHGQVQTRSIHVYLERRRGVDVALKPIGPQHLGYALA